LWRNEGAWAKGIDVVAVSAWHVGWTRIGAMIVYAIVDDVLSPDFPLGDALETFMRRDAET